LCPVDHPHLPSFPTRRSSDLSGLLTTSRARICPFKQRSAAAVNTPSGAPPVPITACTPVPITAAEIPAERSPSPISRIRAPAVRSEEHTSELHSRRDLVCRLL